MEIIKPTAENVSKIVAILKDGGVVICPTDTVYGFLADAQHSKAVAKIYSIKDRPKFKSLPVFVKDIAMASEVAEVNGKIKRFLEKYWPGKVTVVLRRKRGKQFYGIDKETIALRIPNHPFLQTLLAEFNRPVVQTSANLSGKEAITDISRILAVFETNEHVSAIIDGGDLKGGRPSKIVDLTAHKLTVIR